MSISPVVRPISPLRQRMLEDMAVRGLEAHFRWRLSKSWPSADDEPDAVPETTELQHRALIQSQAYGDALAPDRLEKLSRYEVHLDRKLERTLAMLLKLQDLRRPAPKLSQ